MGLRCRLWCRQSVLDKYVAEFAMKGYEAHAFAADVFDTKSLTKLFADVQEKFGVVDALIYNAVFMAGGKASELTDEELRKHFQIDVAGAVHCVQQILPKQLERGEGTIILRADFSAFIRTRTPISPACQWTKPLFARSRKCSTPN